MIMIKKIVFILGLLAINLVVAQKVVKKSILNTKTNFIQVDVSKCFQLNLETSNTDELVVEAIIDGEYKKDLLLNLIEDGQTVLVSTGFSPSFVNPNDKLSAHKVISISLNIKIPKNKNVKVYGVSCNVKAKGIYHNLVVTLGDGQCMLDKVEGTAIVNTHSGDIKVYNAKARINAATKYGTVYKDTTLQDENYYTLSSVTGDIYIRKTE